MTPDSVHCSSMRKNNHMQRPHQRSAGARNKHLTPKWALRATCAAAALLLAPATQAQLKVQPATGTAVLNALGTTGGLAIPGGGTMSCLL